MAAVFVQMMKRRKISPTKRQARKQKQMWLGERLVLSHPNLNKYGEPEFSQGDFAGFLTDDPHIRTVEYDNEFCDEDFVVHGTMLHTICMKFLENCTKDSSPSLHQVSAKLQKFRFPLRNIEGFTSGQVPDWDEYGGRSLFASLLTDEDGQSHREKQFDLLMKK